MATYYAEEDVRKGEGLLTDLISQEKPPTVEKFLRDHRRLIFIVIKKGFSYETIADVFSEVQIEISAEAIEQYFASRKRGAKKRKGKAPDTDELLQQSLRSEQVTAVLAKLNALKQQKNGLTYEEVIDWHFESIVAALDQGWEASDIMAKFAEGGLKLQCTPGSFLQGVKQVKRKRREAELSSGGTATGSAPQDAESTPSPASTTEPVRTTQLKLPNRQRQKKIADEFNV